MLQYYPGLEDVELEQDGQRFFWDHLLPTAHVNSFLHYHPVTIDQLVMPAIELVEG
jgi:hypothetical protein